jgi:hypothetical protein
MKSLIVKNLNLCEKLWNQFTPNTSIWDLWKTVLSFYNQKFFEPYFILGEDQKRRGLLPLWLSKETGRYFFFGGDYPENKRFWFPPEMFLDFFQLMPRRTVLYDINQHSAEVVTHLYPRFKSYFTPDENRYYLDLADVNYSLEKYLTRFSPKHRKNLLYDTNKLLKSGVRLRWGNKNSDFGHLSRLSKARFAGQSDFWDKKFVWQFSSFIQYLKDNRLAATLRAEIGGETIGIGISAIFKNTLYVLNGGFDPKYANVGKLLTLEQIKRALAKHCREVDFLVGDTGWKAFWNLDQEPVAALDKEDIPSKSLRLLTDFK